MMSTDLTYASRLTAIVMVASAPQMTTPLDGNSILLSTNEVVRVTWLSDTASVSGKDTSAISGPTALVDVVADDETRPIMSWIVERLGDEPDAEAEDESAMIPLKWKARARLCETELEVFVVDLWSSPRGTIVRFRIPGESGRRWGVLLTDYRGHPHGYHGVVGVAVLSTRIPASDLRPVISPSNNADKGIKKQHVYRAVADTPVAIEWDWVLDCPPTPVSPEEMARIDGVLAALFLSSEKS